MTQALTCFHADTCERWFAFTMNIEVSPISLYGVVGCSFSLATYSREEVSILLWDDSLSRQDDVPTVTSYLSSIGPIYHRHQYQPCLVPPTPIKPSSRSKYVTHLLFRDLLQGYGLLQIQLIAQSRQLTPNDRCPPVKCRSIERTGAHRRLCQRPAMLVWRHRLLSHKETS